MSAVPTRSENASTGIGYSARWWCSATIQRAFGCASKAAVRRCACPAAINAERVGEREIRVGVRVEQRDPEPILLGGRQNQRKEIVPKPSEASGRPQAACVRERFERVPSRFERDGERGSGCFALETGDARASALDRGDRRQRAHLAQRLDRAERQIEPRRVGPIDDVDIVVAGQNERAPGEVRMSLDDVEKFGPFGGNSRIRHVAADEHEVERLRGVQGREPLHRADEPPVATRPGATAFDAKAVALADDVDIGEMRDPPDSRARTGRRRTPRDRAADRRSRPRSPI